MVAVVSIPTVHPTVHLRNLENGGLRSILMRLVPGNIKRTNVSDCQAACARRIRSWRGSFIAWARPFDRPQLTPPRCKQGRRAASTCLHREKRGARARHTEDDGAAVEL